MPVAKSPADLPDRRALLSMSGLAYLQKMLAGDIARAPITALMEFDIHAVEKGRAVFRGTPGFAHANQMGGLHGGWSGTILDSCMACAVMSMLEPGRIYTTLEFKTNLTRTILPGTPVEAVGTIQHCGRTTAVANGEIRGVGDGRLYATGSTTCLLMRPDDAP
jgi:uncharacterized protein (TIGR00369 family)